LIKVLRAQINLFFLSLSFFSRIPVPKSVEYSAKLLNQSGRYFSLVGLLLAAILVVFYLVVQPYFSDTVAIILLVILSLILTGAFHEDGLADMADGIGGGLTVAQRLDIMKDSRIGTYGALSLLMALLLKLMLLIELAQQQQVIASLLLGYGLSRALAASLIFDMTYVTESSGGEIKASKSKPLANQQSLLELLILVSIGLLPLLLFPLYTSIIILAVLLIFRGLFKKWLNANIGGYTGDCLGACQQISELLIYLVIIANVVTPTTAFNLSIITDIVKHS